MLTSLTVVNYILYVSPLDAQARYGFGGENRPAFLSEVMCNGLEEKLTTCNSMEGTGDQKCASAGVTCGKSASESTILTQDYMAH